MSGGGSDGRISYLMNQGPRSNANVVSPMVDRYVQLLQYDLKMTCQGVEEVFERWSDPIEL
jgi:hypothetical protein